MVISMTQLRQTWFCTTLLMLFFAIGCGGNNSSSVTQPDEDSSTSEDTPQTASPDSGTKPSTPAPNDGSLVVQRDGKKWIGDVPVDVWYDDPLSVAATSGQVAQPTATPETQVAKVDNPAPENQPEAVPEKASDGIDWESVIPAELLDAEVTSIRNRFNADLQTVGSYNSSYLAIPPHVVTLAVMAHIATKHPGEIRWKENAKYIRHLAGEMNAEPLRRGPSSQRPLKEKFENILVILNGSVPATVEAPPDDQSVSDVAKVSYIMKRLENCDKNISVNGGTADAMKEKAEVLKQEAAVLGALTQVMLDGYEDYQDDEVFAGYVKNMVDASKTMRESIKADQFEQFDLAVSEMKKACTECHSTYR